MLSYYIIQEKEIKEKWMFILQRISDGKKDKELLNSYHTSLLSEPIVYDDNNNNGEHRIDLDKNINKIENKNEKIANDVKNNKKEENDNYDKYISDLKISTVKIKESENGNGEVESLHKGTYRVRDALLRTYGVTMSNECTGQTVLNQGR